MQTLDYKSLDPTRQSMLAVVALVYSVIAGPVSPVLTLLLFGDVDEPWLITTEQRYLLFGLWIVLVGVAMGLLAIIRVRKLNLRGQRLAYIGLCISGFWAFVLVAVYLRIL